MNNQHETLCWGCKYATIAGCQWMDAKQAVPGWTATATFHKCQNGTGYNSY